MRSARCPLQCAFHCRIVGANADDAQSARDMGARALGKHRIVIEGQSFEVDVIARTARGAEVSVDGVRYRVDVPAVQPAPAAVETPAPKHAAKRVRSGAHEVRSPMAGRVIGLRVAPGAEVRAGDALLVLDAMKMENTISAAGDGRVDGFDVAVGDTVLQGALLVRLSPT
jgi:biotin carboxyl carrier protein